MVILLMEMDEVRIANMLSGERIKIAPGTASSGVPVWAKGKTPKTQLIDNPSYLFNS